MSIHLPVLMAAYDDAPSHGKELCYVSLFYGTVAMRHCITRCTAQSASPPVSLVDSVSCAGGVLQYSIPSYRAINSIKNALSSKRVRFTVPP